MKIGLRSALAAAGLLVSAAALADQAPQTGASVEQAAPPAAAPGKKQAPPAAALPPAKDKDKPTGDAAAPKKEMPPEERAARGVVTIERAGQVVGLGMVLAGDGRILTALSPLGSGNDLEARFADNSTVRVKLGHHDRPWDLALLVPQAGKWPEGLTAAMRDPVRPDANIHAFTLKQNKIAPTTMVLRSKRTLLGGDDKQLENAIELGSRVSPADLGTPIVDEDGRVVAIMARGCAPNENKPCTPVAFGAPVSAIKSFLRSVPPTAVPPAPWLGIQGVAETAGPARGVRILTVYPNSPADEAKLKGGEGDKDAGDVILAVGGVPVTTPDALADQIRAHGVGQKVQLTLLSHGKYRDVYIVLRAAPEARAATPPPANPAELPPAEGAPPPAAPAPKKR